MLYLVGGPSRSGKSIIAHRLLEQEKIPYFRTDYLVTDHKPKNKAEIYWPALKHVFEDAYHDEEKYLVEGDIILPKYIADFIKEWPQTKVCFLGYPNITPEEKLREIRKYVGSNDDWLKYTSDEEVINFLKETIELSKEFKKECMEYNLKFFDTSINFESQIDLAISFLNT